jgi:hypothetical protein
MISQLHPSKKGNRPEIIPRGGAVGSRWTKGRREVIALLTLRPQTLQCPNATNYVQEEGLTGQCNNLPIIE